jgi:hypothetical protein
MAGSPGRRARVIPRKRSLLVLKIDIMGEA